MASTREENVYMAKLAQQANRYEDMVEFMKKAAELAKAEVIELTIEERDLLVAAYRKLSNARRASCRTVSTIMHKEESKGNENRVAAIRDYRAKIESEISSICDGFLSLLDDCLVPDAFTYESRAFYLMLKGDYHRYLAEIKMAADRDAAAQSALDAYTSAQAAARFGLEPMHPIRLELALNFSLFYYYILKSPDLARNLGKQAIDDASAAIDALGGGRGHMLKLDYDAMMLRLDQNLRLWSSDAQDDEKDEIGASSQGNRNQDDK